MLLRAGTMKIGLGLVTPGLSLCYDFYFTGSRLGCGNQGCIARHVYDAAFLFVTRPTGVKK